MAYDHHRERLNDSSELEYLREHRLGKQPQLDEPMIH
jgi:hypothetical protein